MSREWDLYYAGWIIGDGEPDRSVGETFEWFAISFWPPQGGLHLSTEKVKSALTLHNFVYRVTAEVVWVTGEACVIDFGLKVAGYSDRLPAGCGPGDYVTGGINLKIAHSIPAIVPQGIMSSLAHTWLVKEVYADLTPFREIGPSYKVRDEEKIKYEVVRSTADIDAHGYVLRCVEIS